MHRTDNRVFAGSPLLASGTDEGNPFSSSFHGFWSRIVVERYWMNRNTFFLVFRVATAINNAFLHHSFSQQFTPTRKQLAKWPRNLLAAKQEVLFWRHNHSQSLARFCTPPEVKFHVFRRLKRGEEKSISKIFFRCWYQDTVWILSSK